MTTPEFATPLRRGPLLVTSALAALGGAAIPAVAIVGLWRIWQLYAMLSGLLALVEIAAAIILLGWPTRRTVRFGALPPAATLVVWLSDRVFGIMRAPDPWQPADTVLGFTDYLDAGLQVIALAGLLIVAARGRRRTSRAKLVTAWIALVPVMLLVVVTSAAGVTAAADGFQGTGVPPGAVLPAGLPAGQMSTVEYCRPTSIPLAMDLHMPPATGTRPAPVALYVHGGGLILGDRKPGGPGATLANSSGALFTPLQRELNARGFVVASIDYRLAPAAPWPAQLTDAKCAVRFLKSHASDLGIDPERIAVWGSSAGGTLAALLGTAGGFDIGQYLGRTSGVRAVVDMFGPADFTNLAGFDTVLRATIRIGLGTSPETLRAASPVTYITPGAPPFLILQGEDVVARQSADYAARLRTAGVPVDYVAVRGTGHSLDTPTQTPSPAELVTTIADFLTRVMT